MLKSILSALVIGAFSVAAMPSLATAQTDIAWGTSAVGSSGHRALTNLATVLNRELPEYRVTVQPMPGAILTVKGYATGEIDGYYGADIAFYEFANDINRFEGFQAEVARDPVQSFWSFTVEVGAAVHARDQDKFNEWRDLTGERVFTGPLPWDVRAQLERAFSTVGVEHEYLEVDLDTAGSLLEQGGMSGFIIYTNAEATTAPWITTAGLSADWAALNPSEEELDILRDAGFSVIEVDPKVFERDTHTDTVVLLPFYYGFHVGLDMSEDDVYQMLNVIEQNADELAELDSGFAQVRDDMAGLQRRGVEASIEFVEVHPGLARWMREKDVWDAAWDDRVARD